MNSNFLYLGLLSPSVVDGLGNRRWYWLIHIFVFSAPIHERSSSSLALTVCVFPVFLIVVLHLQMTSSGTVPGQRKVVA